MTLSSKLITERAERAGYNAVKHRGWHVMMPKKEKYSMLYESYAIH